MKAFRNMECIISGGTFVLALVAAAHALQSSSIPQEEEIVSSEELTIDSLVKDVEQLYKQGAEKIVKKEINYIVDRLLCGNILGASQWDQDFLYLVSCRLDESQAVVLAELLLTKYRCNPNTRDEDGESALMSAGFANRPRLVKLLLQHGADIDCQNNEQYTALHYAGTYGGLESVKLLLESGANTSLKNSSGYTALQLAHTKHHHGVVALFKSHEYRKSFAVVVGLNYYTAQQIIAPKTMSNVKGLFKVDKSALLNILTFLKIKGE